MKRLTKIFQALLGVAALVITTLIAMGRLSWRTIRDWLQKRSKCVRRVLSFILILIPVGVVTLAVYSYFDVRYGRWYWKDEPLTNNVELHGFRDYKYRVYNISTGKYTTRKINWVSDVSEVDSLAVYAMPNKRGFINVRTGEIVIDAEANNYCKAWVFSEGLAAVVKDKRVGFINAKNEVVIPFQYKCSPCDVSYVFHDGYCILNNNDGDFGIIDKTGKWVVAPEYDEIWQPHSGGYRIVIDDEKFGVLDSTCAVVYPVEYDDIEVLSDGFLLVKSGKKWQVDFDGRVVKAFMFDNSFYLKYPVGYDDYGDMEYAFADCAMYQVDDYYGIMNRVTGLPITPALYLDINMLSKDLFEVQDPESCDWYLVDGQGNMVSTPPPGA